MEKSNNFFISFIKYLVIFILMLCGNLVHPLIFGSTAVYISFLNAYYPPLLLSVIFVLSFTTFKSIQMLLVGLIQATLLGGLFSLYKMKNRQPKMEIIFFYFASVLPYILWCGEIEQTLLYSGIVCVASFITTTAQGYLWAILHKVKPSPTQGLSMGISLILLGTGLINLLGINAYKAICVLALLFSIKCFEKSPYILSGLIALPLFIITNNQAYFCIVFLWFAFAVIFSQSHSFYSSVSIVLADILCYYFLDFYSSYSIIEGIWIGLPAMFFALLPQQIFTSIKDYFRISTSELLSFNYINRSRMNISSQLYEMSGVFFQMENCFFHLNKNVVTNEQIIDKISEQTINSACSECLYSERCKFKNFPSKEILAKFIRIGLSKKKLTFIDLPREFSEQCTYPNSIIFEINRLIGEFLGQIDEKDSKNSQRELILTQTTALGKIMKNLAFEMSKTLRPNAQREKTIFNYLKTNGMPVLGVLVLGEGLNTEINIFAKISITSNPRFQPLLNQVCGEILSPIKSELYNEKTIFLTYGKKPNFDAIFGVGLKTKHGSTTSGDNHSLIKINQGNFLIALSDGMGSGQNANDTSSISLNLIESYYRAGLDSQSVLEAVNKILTLDKSDNFSAVDISSINLYNGECDFIKIGSPYGFIVSNSGVKFIEGSSLPLGILDEIKPSTAKVNLHSNDVIVLLSDGVTDAFGSSSEMVEFLRNAPLSNPQNLADSIIEKALAFSHNVAHDDMTALCVRIIES